MTSNSGNNNTGNNNGGNDTGGNNNSSPPNISDLTQQLQDSGPPDLLLSNEVAKAYQQIITTFYLALHTQRDNISNMAPLGNPGTLNSAVEMVNNFKLDVSGLEGIEPALDQFLNYLNEVGISLQKATGNLILADEGLA